MYYGNRSLHGALYFTIGLILFIVFAGNLFLRLLGALIALILMHKGLQLMGYQSLHYTIESWRHRMRF
jgi:uncharacterized membrane protein YfbV (UPF0208 family)